MLVDARALPDRSVIEADVCIVGSGPAGLTLARELRRRSIRVCLIEAGGAALDDANERLALVTPAGGDLDFPRNSRRRQLGGTANAWDAPIPGNRQGVRMRPLDPIDFEVRDWVPDSGWPFGFDELAPHYASAQRLLGLRLAGDASDEWPEAGASWPLDSALVRTAIDQFLRRRLFVRHWARQLIEDDDTQIVLWANAIRLEMGARDSSVDCLQLACLDRKRHTVRASTYILAAGGIENPRLLLVSGGSPGRGVANDHDLVGRFFMDHVWVPMGTLELAGPAAFASAALYDTRRIGDALVSGRLQLSDRVQRDERLLNGAVAITPRPSARQAQAVAAFRYLRWRRVSPGASSYSQAALSLLRSAPYAAALFSELAWRQRRFPPTIASGWSDVARGGSRFAGMDLELQLELSPRPDNRVALLESCDVLGVPTAGVAYRFGEFERTTVVRTRALIAQAIEQAGLGRVTPPTEGEPLARAASIHHHLGTTRMHESPTRGVVDPDSKVHGVANLYVAGSSVFPTGGYANPTLTIIALALRLADHLANEA